MEKIKFNNSELSITYSVHYSGKRHWLRNRSARGNSKIFQLLYLDSYTLCKNIYEHAINGSKDFPSTTDKGKLYEVVNYLKEQWLTKFKDKNPSVEIDDVTYKNYDMIKDLKIGDKVKVKQGHSIGTYYWDSEMNQYVDETYTIKDCISSITTDISSCKSINVYRLQSIPGWYFAGDFLELVEEKQPTLKDKFPLNSKVQFIDNAGVLLKEGDSVMSFFNTCHIPSKKIKHGACSLKHAVGYVKDYHDKYIIVSFIATTGLEVILGFEEKNLKLYSSVKKEERPMIKDPEHTGINKVNYSLGTNEEIEIPIVI